MKRWDRTATAVLSAALIFSMAPAGVQAALYPTQLEAVSHSGVVRMSAADTEIEAQDPAVGQNEPDEAGYSAEEPISSGIDSENAGSAAEVSVDEQQAVDTETDSADWSGNNEEAAPANDREAPDLSVNDEETDSAVPVQTGEAEDSENIVPDEDNTGASENDAADGDLGEDGESDADNAQVNIDPAAEPNDAANGESVLFGEIVGAGETSVDPGDLDALYADYANRMFYGVPLNPG